MIYRLFPTMGKMSDALTQCDLPPTLYSLMESKVNFGNDNPVKIEALPENFRNYLFDFSYPLDDIYKENFENMFLTHYMFRRIGFETYLSFKLHLKVKLNEIMPKYNKMLEGFSKLNFNGFVEPHDRVTSDISNGQTITNNTLDSRNSNTPQGQLSDVRSGEYVDNYMYNQNDTTTNANANTNTNENITIKRSDEIDEYKKFIDYVNNIYSDIFKECDSLFYGLV